MSENNSALLEGIKVLELTTMVFGPAARLGNPGQAGLYSLGAEPGEIVQLGREVQGTLTITGVL